MKVAGVQCDIRIGDKSRNIDQMCSALRVASDDGAQLAVFPECSVTGYCFASFREALNVADPIPGPATDSIAAACLKYRTHAIVGLIEKAGDDLFNAAVLVGPSGVIASYRKVHLPFLGVDRFTTPGNRPFAVHPMVDAKVGLLICYDASFPESARCLTLLGADLIALPTNWPPGAECVVANTIACRAMENGVYFMAVNRVGVEAGFRFIGGSQICDPSGRVIYRCGVETEEIFYAEVDLEKARRKHVVRVPGQHEIDRLADRRPAMYGPLVEPHALRRPGRDFDREQEGE